jgi:hypothetical protein
VKDKLEHKKESRVKIGDIIFITILVLLPGVRGYDNWQIHEYAFFIIIILAIVYSWITGNRFWEKKATSSEEKD